MTLMLPIKILLPIFLLGCLLSCVQVAPKKNSSRDQTPERAFENNELQFQFFLEDQGTPYFYQMGLKWTQPLSKAHRVYINGEDITLDSAAMSLNFPVPAGQRYSVEVFDFSAEGEWVSLWNKTFETPKDLVINDLILLKKNTELQAERIFFQKKGKVLTQGHSLIIKTKALYSDDGIIETFSENSTAFAEQAGRSGGAIHIEAEVGQGDLTILLRGENGGTGKAGTPWPHPQVNARAATPSIINLMGGGIPQCLVPPEDGVDGPKGNKGFAGLKGAPGGDSGSLEIKIALPTESLKYNVERLPGKGGAGGPGGPGQVGGQPSSPGVKIFPCKAGKPGKRLGDGDPGEQGPSGLNGSIQPYCVQFGLSEKLCYQ